MTEQNWAKSLDEILGGHYRQDDFSRVAMAHKKCFPYLYRLGLLERDLFVLFLNRDFRHPRIKKNITWMEWVLEKIGEVQPHLERHLAGLRHRVRYQRYETPKPEWPEMLAILEVLTTEQKGLIEVFGDLRQEYLKSWENRDMETERIVALEGLLADRITRYNQKRNRFEELFKGYRFTASDPKAQ